MKAKGAVGISPRFGRSDKRKAESTPIHRPLAPGPWSPSPAHGYLIKLTVLYWAIRFAPPRPANSIKKRAAGHPAARLLDHPATGLDHAAGRQQVVKSALPFFCRLNTTQRTAAWLGAVPSTRMTESNFSSTAIAPEQRAAARIT